MRKAIILTALVGALFNVTAWAETKRLTGDDLVYITQGGPYLVHTTEGEYFHITFYKDGTHIVNSGFEAILGTWKIVNDTLCLDTDGDKYCIYYELQFDGAFKAFHPDGKHKSTFVGKAGLLRIYVDKKVRWFQSGNLAVETFNSPQLEYLFLGSEVEGSGERCTPEEEGAPSEYLATLKFKENKNYIGAYGCGDDDTDQVEISGTWTTNNNEFCLTFPHGNLFFEELKGGTVRGYEGDGRYIPEHSGGQQKPGHTTTCWNIVRSTWGVAAVDKKGNEDWTMTIQSHPKHSSKKEIFALLDKMWASPGKKPSSNQTVEQRLEELKTFVDRGLITKDEADKRRKEILKGL